MNNISDFGFIIEALIKGVAWLVDLFVGEHKSAAHNEDHRAADAVTSQTGSDRSESVELPVPAPAAGNGGWAPYFDKQAALGTDRATSAAQPFSTRPTKMENVRGMERKKPRWVKDFGPGSLGAFLMTLGLLAFIYFSDMETTSEATQILLFAELICLPASLVTGALFGALGGLLTKRIAQALHLGNRAQGAAITVASFISGAVAGFLCDAFSLIGASI